MRALQRGYLERGAIELLEPEVMLALPRLAVLAGLVHMPDAVNMTGDRAAADGGGGGGASGAVGAAAASICFRWFRPHAHEFAQLQLELLQLSKERLEELEELLVREAPPERPDAAELAALYKRLCALSLAVQRGPWAKEFVRTLSAVFAMHVGADEEAAAPAPAAALPAPGRQSSAG